MNDSDKNKPFHLSEHDKLVEFLGIAAVATLLLGFFVKILLL